MLDRRFRFAVTASFESSRNCAASSASSLRRSRSLITQRPRVFRWTFGSRSERSSQASELRCNHSFVDSLPHVGEAEDEAQGHEGRPSSCGARAMGPEDGPLAEHLGADASEVWQRSLAALDGLADCRRDLDDSDSGSGALWPSETSHCSPFDGFSGGPAFSAC